MRPFPISFWGGASGGGGGGSVNVTSIRVWIWVVGGDSLTALQTDIQSGPGSGTSYFSTTSFGTPVLVLSSNDYGFDVYYTDITVDADLPTGTPIWLTLSNAASAEGDGAYWDESDGTAASAAEQNGDGGTAILTPATESFQIYDGATDILDNLNASTFQTNAWFIWDGYSVSDQFTLT